ncbi:MAG: hypothetical protein A4S08_12900 [Proteobacteria bacterium SG_bin4]|nr:MAG: hypothetical protein A4S08_12900 [Proteobacteria bacterium SG_bin4]
MITLIMLTACVSTPTAPSVITLPGKGISFEQFRVDDYDCRMLAFQHLEGKTPQSAPAAAAMHRNQRQFDIHYIQCMYARGHRVPMLGRLTGDPADVEAGNPKINAPPSDSKPPVPPAGNPPSPPSR